MTTTHLSPTYMNTAAVMEALATAQSALQLVATPVRPDGTYNYDRRACEKLAGKALADIGKLLAPAAATAAAEAPIGTQFGMFDAEGDETARAVRTLSRSPSVQVEAFYQRLAANAPRAVTVYTDGGCRPSNPGPAGWGVVIASGDTVIEEASGFIGPGTNQIAELEAAIQGLRRTPEGSIIELVSDSQYVLKGLTEWRAGWERRQWRNAAGEAVANQDRWKALFALADKRKVRARWVKGHSGNPFNERCDKLASQAITAGRAAA